MNRFSLILKNLCNMCENSGMSRESIVETLVDAGAKYYDLKALDFTDSDIESYVSYMSVVGGVSRSKARRKLS